MKNYKIVLRSSGPVTQLPDSQKIFGALVTELSRMQGEDAASELVQSVYNRNIHFALSNLFPKGYLPVPQEYILGKIAESLSKEVERCFESSRFMLRPVSLYPGIFRTAAAGIYGTGGPGDRRSGEKVIYSTRNHTAENKYCR